MRRERRPGREGAGARRAGGEGSAGGGVGEASGVAGEHGRSLADRGRYYTGITANPVARLGAHNAGRSPHTAKGKSWALDVLIEFADEARALAFERYLKSGSGVAFARRHLR